MAYYTYYIILDELAKKKCKPEMETNPLFNRIYNLVRRLPFVCVEMYFSFSHNDHRLETVLIGSYDPINMSSGQCWVPIPKNCCIATLQQYAQSAPQVGDGFSLLLPSVAGQC